MNTRFFRFRRLAVAALTGATVMGGVSLIAASPASAYSGLSGPVAATTPTVYPGTASQAAGDWTFHISNSFVSGDTVTLLVSPTGNSGNATSTDTNCVAAGNSVGFASTPTVSVVPDSGSVPAGDKTPTVSDSISTFTTDTDLGAHCTSQGVKDLLTIQFTNTFSGVTAEQWDFTVAGAKYTLGANVATGNLPVSVNNGTFSNTGATSGPSNAFVGLASVTANSPAAGIQSASGNTPTADTPIGNVVVTEFAFGAVPSGYLCFKLSNGTWDSTGNGGASTVHTPVMTISGSGGATATSAVTATTTYIVVDVTASTTNPGNTFTLSGLAVDATSSTGPKTVTVYGNAGATCGTTTTVVGHHVAYVVVGTYRYYGSVADATAAANYAQYPGAYTSCGATTGGAAVLATDGGFQDALSAAYLSAYLNDSAGLGGGVLLTPTAALSSYAANAIRANDIQVVYVVGGPLAISDAVVSQLESTPYYCGGVPQVTTDGAPEMLQVVRIYGQTALDTSQDIAEYVPSSFVGTDSSNPSEAYSGQYNDTSGSSGSGEATAPTSGVPTAILATGSTWYDALGGSATSAYWDFPILLTNGSSLSTQASNAIIDLGIQQVIVLGGPLAISDTVVAQLEALGVSVLRIAGANYVDTSQLLAAFSENCYDDATGLYYGLCDDEDPWVVRGDFYADGLSVSLLTGEDYGAPLLLTQDPNTVGASLDSWMNQAGSSTGFNTLDIGSPYSFYTIYVSGGPLAVSATTLQNMVNDIATGANS